MSAKFAKLIFALVLSGFSCLGAQISYVRTPRDTGMPPETTDLRLVVSEESSLVHQSESLRVFYR